MSGSGSGVVAAAEYVGFHWPQGLGLWLCSSFTPDGGSSVYWAHAPGSSAAGGHWTTDASAECAPAVADVDRPNPSDVTLADPYVCPALVALAGLPAFADPAGPVHVAPDGDVSLAVGGRVWDCPPYGG